MPHTVDWMDESVDSILVATAAKPTRPRPDDNEDQCGISQLPDRWALIVCDRALSSPYAQHAARIACASFVDVMTSPAAINPDAWPVRIKEALRQAHQQILHHFPRGDALTTATAALILPEQKQVIVATVGDSPAYYVQGETLTLCTPADVRRVARLENGKPVIRDGLPILDRALTAALGFRQTLEPHLFTATYAPGDTLILCSDGVTTETVSVISQ